MRFKGKVVWITGASSGIGEALAHAFHGEGAQVILSARRVEELNRVANDLGDGADSPMVVALDLADAASLSAAAGLVRDRFGSVDILVNNAGRTMRAVIANTRMEVFRDLFETNFFGPLALAKLVLPGMSDGGGGRMVVISSIAAKYSTPLRAGYSASKAALERIFDALRVEEWSNGIAVTTIVLGSANTNISVNAATGDGGVYGRKNRIQAEGMDPDDVARRILDAISRGRREVMIAPLAQCWQVWRARYFPRWSFRAVRLPARPRPPET
jgi:dehydrogenase/reductase SDR family member 7B